tara:strand:- start:7 stop:438 length:432 start_codon:yes stop_codon:yes gene_type:complete
MDMDSPEWKGLSDRLKAKRQRESQVWFSMRRSALAEVIREAVTNVICTGEVTAKQEKEYFSCKEEDKFFQYNVLRLVRATMDEIIPQVMEEASQRVLAVEMTHDLDPETEKARDQWRKDNPDLAQKSILDEDNEGAKFTLARR